MRFFAPRRRTEHFAAASGQGRHQSGAEHGQRRAHHVAHQSHQDAHRHQGAGVGAGQHRRGGGAADIGQGGNAGGEEVQLQQLADDEHQHGVDGQHDEAGEDPCRRVAQFQQACAGGQQADDRVEQQVGNFHGTRDLAQRRHGGDQRHGGDEEDGPGGLVGEVGPGVELGR